MYLKLFISLLFVLLLAWGAGIAVTAQAEVFGFGGGLGVYPLELTELKAKLSELGAPAEDLADVPDMIPLPHLGARLWIGMPLPLLNVIQFAVNGLNYAQLLDAETGLQLHVTSLAVNLELLTQLQVLFFGAAFGLGLGLINGQVNITATDPQITGVLEQVGLSELRWAATDAHGVAEVDLILGPLRVYVLGRYLSFLTREAPQGLVPGDWQAELGLLLAF